ncbi:hypothetical protein [Aquimarina aggregata]|uniref:hypothetical protein n=1 Tax=Aquimarina aggregata TaxID=1642818 RepID=UPI002491FEC5|nr:hypothetical protein [Aquimarina aggregata]
MKTQTHLSKYILLFTVLIISIFFFHSCQQDSTIDVFEEEEYLKKIEAYEAKIAALEEKLGQEKLNRRRPNHIISLRKAQLIYKAYDKRADLISDAVGPVDDVSNSGRRIARFEPTRSLFYEISDLRNYLAYIDELSEKAGIKPTGLRFYFALYPENYISPSGSNENARRQTIFIAPTTEKEYENRIVQMGYTLNNDFKVVFLDKDNGFSYLRRNLGKNTTGYFGKTDDYDKYSLLANDMGSYP